MKKIIIASMLTISIVCSYVVFEATNNFNLKHAQANSKDIELTKKIGDKIAKADFQNKVQNALNEKGYKTRGSILEIYSPDKKILKIKINSPTKTSKKTITKIVEQVAKDNNLGHFTVELIE